MQMADRFHLPLVTLIDTPGAYPGIGAEQRGQGGKKASATLHRRDRRTHRDGADGNGERAGPGSQQPGLVVKSSGRSTRGAVHP